MPAPILYPMVNGNRHSFVSIELKLKGSKFVGFKSINYGRKRSRGLVHGAHPDPLGKTQGTNEYNADCELYLEEWNLFQSTLGPGYGDLYFLTTVTYGTSPLSGITDLIIGCTVDSTEASQSQGNDPLVRKVDMMPLKILFGGQDDALFPLALASFGGIGSAVGSIVGGAFGF